MSWEQLSLEIGEMFDAYSRRADDITGALIRREIWRRSRNTARYSNAWAKRNPERVKQYVKISRRRAKERDPDRYRAMRAAQNKRYRMRLALRQAA